MSIITMHTLIRMITSERYSDTGSFVTDINKRLCESTIVQSGGGFITLFYAAIDTRNHVMRWTSAGHPPALLHDRRTNTVSPVGGNNEGGLPLGITAEMGYDVMTAQIPPGGRVLIYSDGLTDALAPSGRESTMFGVDGICRSLQACCDLSFEETMEALFRDSRDFTEGEGRHDDTSVVLVEAKGLVAVLSRRRSPKWKPFSTPKSSPVSRLVRKSPMFLPNGPRGGASFENPDWQRGQFRPCTVAPAATRRTSCVRVN